MDVRKHLVDSIDLERCHKFHGNQSDLEDLIKVISVAKSFDIIIDDGSHMGRDQQLTLKHLMPFLNPGGIYIIEDLLCNRERN